MKTRILIMRPGEPAETREVELPDDDKPHNGPGTYETLKEIVEPITGEPFEHVTVLADFTGGNAFRRADMFVNGNGQLENPPLPRNDAATEIYRRNAVMYQGEAVPELLPDIVGPAILFEDIVWR